MLNEQRPKEKSYVITLLLCLFFGLAGFHRFYTGYNKIGTIQCLLTLSLIGVYVSGIWVLIDLISIIFGRYKAYNGELLIKNFLITSNNPNIVIEYSCIDDSADKLLRMATEYKTDDINKAIDYLKKAYIEIAKTKTEYSVETFLRLPLYLQEANKSNEALIEFNNLLNNGYPNEHRIKILIPMHQARIYDKLRLFWQREKQPVKAISYGVYSILLDALGLYRQKRKEELNFIKDKAHIIDRIIPLYKKAQKLDLIDKAADLILTELQKLPKISTHSEIEEMVNNLLQNP